MKEIIWDGFCVHCGLCCYGRCEKAAANRRLVCEKLSDREMQAKINELEKRVAKLECALRLR